MTIKLYWWNRQSNFGDALNPLIVSSVSGKPVVWADNSACDMFAIGSITRQIRRGFFQAKDWRPAVWGSGIMGPHRLDFLENVDFFSVRGPITADLLGVKVESFGDPGLLASDLVEERPSGDRIGIIPHHSSFRSEHILKNIELLKEKENAIIIDVRNKDTLGVIKEIQSCRIIFSESLHGLIVADSLSIPNIWVSGRKIHDNPNLKFLDYFLSIGRRYSPPINYNEIEDLTGERELSLAYRENVEKVKVEILNSFPPHLKSNMSR